MTRAVAVLVPRIGEERRPRGEPLSKLWDEYLRDGLHQHAPSTLRTIHRTRELARTLQDHPTPREIAAWLSSLYAAGYGAGTVRLFRDWLHAVFAYSNATGAAIGNPVALSPWRAPKPHRQAIRGVSAVWPFLEAVALDVREAAYWGVMRFAGLRPGEARGLLVTDVLRSPLLPSWQLSVTKQRGPGSLACAEFPKTDTSLRRVEVCAPLKVLLAKTLKLGRPKVRVGRGGGEVVISDLLFPYRINDDSDGISRLRGVCPADFPPGDAFHVFRHSFAVECVENGVALEDLQLMLGHSSLKDTSTYISSLVGRGPRKGVLDFHEKKRGTAQL